MLGKHPNTIYEWVQRGALPAEKLGGTIYVPKWALARLISPAADHGRRRLRPRLVLVVR